MYIAKELCRGLAYAHAFPDLNLVHRDISPPNVLVSYTGEVKLTDFGLASSTLKVEKTAPGIIYGKVAYMSPEQARGEKLDGRSDMYAAGIVLWELLTGRQLFPPGKDQPQDLVARAKNPEVMRPSKRAPRVPVELDEICVKALAADKNERYGNCDEMRQALQTWLAQNAPTTDGTRMSGFLEELFSEDIVRERAERVDMIARVRTRALTMPPTDELRQLIEKSDKVSIRDLGAEDEDTAVTEIDESLAGDPPVRKPGSVGRRASDLGNQGTDRRREADRRGGRASSPAIRTGDASAAMALAQQPQEAPELDVGSEVDGRYKIVELIGEGGMGKVYLAEHVEIGKRVALKVLHPSYSRMPDLVERFRREARAASKIGHPNIVDVTDSGATADGSVYFVMEYLEGVELGSVIEREGALDVGRGLRISTQICRALSAAHREGIIHRDLKPENIFLITRGGEADVVKVLDFGIAKTTEAEAARERRLTSPGMAMGTPEYMAPEQAAGRPADARTDVYSLGAIVYEMTTGVPPYQGDNFMEILTKKATVDPAPPTSVRAEIPAQVSDLVMLAMSRDPDRRPQTMEAFEYELNKCLSGRGVAVAQILGVTTDANVVATLNAGLSMRNVDDGIVRSQSTVSRATTHGGSSDQWEVRSGVYRGGQSGPVGIVAGRANSEPSPGRVPRASGSAPQSGPVIRPSGSMAPLSRAATPLPVALQQTAAASSGAIPEQSSEPAPRLKRGALATFGWITLVLVLLGGASALAYVYLQDRTDVPAGTANASGSADQAQAAAGSAAPASPAAVKHDGSAAAGSAHAGSAQLAGAGSAQATSAADGSAADDIDAGSGDEVDEGSAVEPKHGHAKIVRVANHHGAPHHTVAEERDPKALAKQAHDLESSGDWAGARALYEKLEKNRAMAGYAVYREAWAAFQMGDVTAAQALAQKAATIPGKQQLDAKFLYADALFKQGDYGRAKDVYLFLRSKLADPSKKAYATKKVATCNEKLHLPDADGIKD